MAAGAALATAQGAQADAAKAQAEVESVESSLRWTKDDINRLYERLDKLEGLVAALVREAQEAEAARRVAPAWTAPKPNRAWVQRGRISTPFKLKFRVTPFVDGDLDEDMRLEDAAGEEGVFVAGIGE